MYLLRALRQHTKKSDAFSLTNLERASFLCYNCASRIEKFVQELVISNCTVKKKANDSGFAIAVRCI